MNWFPKFLNIGPAALAAAAAVPALLLLYFLKLRRREQTVASTLLWKKAIQDLQVNAPFQKLRRNLLLLLQMILLALLLLALARPITFFSAGAGKNTVILIDRSASMQAKDVDGHSRLDAAKKRAKALVETLERDGKAMVIAFDDTAETVQPWSSDQAALKTAIDNITPTDRRSRLKQAYQMAEALTHFDANQLRPAIEPPDVYVLSDGRVLDGNDLSINGNLRYEKIGSDNAGNIALVSLNAKRDYEHPNEVQIFARLANYGPEPQSADVELWVAPLDDDGKGSDQFVNRGAAAVRLVPERWDEKNREGQQIKDSVEFTLDLSTAAVVRVEQKNRNGDQLAADDMASVVLPPPKQLSVLLVTDGNYYLERAVSSLSLKGPVTMSSADYEQKQPANFDVIIFDRHAPSKLPAAGNLICFDCVPPGLKLKAETANNQQVVLSELGVLDWEREHPILRYLSLTKLYAAEGIKLDVPLEGKVLIEGTKGPLVVLDREGKTTSLVVSFDVLQSNWPLRISFPIFLKNALEYMALGSTMEMRQSFQPGDTPRIPRANLDRAGANLKSIRLLGPGISRELPIPLAGDFALPPLNAVGVYRLDPIVPEYERLAVNLLDSNESNLTPVDRPPGNIGTAVVAGGGRSRLDLWWWIVACGALPLLMIEWWVYTRRVHL